MMSLVLIAAYLLVIGVIYLAYIMHHQYTYWKRRNMLHIEYIPIFGNMAPFVFRTVAIPIHIRNLYNKLPGARYYGMMDFTKPTIVVKDTELIRDICVKSFGDFVNHDAFLTEAMDPIVGRNLFSLKDERWKEVRNTVTPSFTAARMKVLFKLIDECSKDFVQYFVERPEVAKNFEAKDAFSRYATDVIGTAAFGVKVDSMKDRENDFYRHGKATTLVSIVSIIKFELMRRFSTLMRLAGATFLPKATDRFFKRLISETVKVRREKGIVREDMIHLMMQAMDKEDGIKVTVDDIIGQAFFFFLAGFDTTSSSMCFLIHELAANPGIQEKLRQEIDEKVEEDGGQITYESLTKMKYLDMVVSETLRKYPTAPLTNRLCKKDHVLPAPMEGYPEHRVEEGTPIIIPIFGLHRDPKYFPEPEKFDPERFNDENKSKIDPYAYMPFGHGPRQCIGNRFALMEIKIVIIHLLRNFIIRFTEKSKKEIVFAKKVFSMTSKDGFWFNFEERKKTN